MNKTASILSIIGIIIGVWLMGTLLWREVNFITKVTQDVQNIAGPTLVTEVYFEGERMQIYFDNIEDKEYNDSTAFYRKKEGELLINKIRKTLRNE